MSAAGNDHRPHQFRVRRVKSGTPLEPENQVFVTQMLAIEYAETLDLGRDEILQVLEGSDVVWASHAK
jgi:hypothetical protein